MAINIIACTTGTVAVYYMPLGPDHNHVSTLPVEAWDMNGNALVAGERGLEDATKRIGLGRYAHLDQAENFITRDELISVQEPGRDAGVAPLPNRYSFDIRGNLVDEDGHEVSLDELREIDFELFRSACHAICNAPSPISSQEEARYTIPRQMAS